MGDGKNIALPSIALHIFAEPNDWLCSVNRVYQATIPIIKYDPFSLYICLIIS